MATAEVQRLSSRNLLSTAAQRAPAFLDACSKSLTARAVFVQPDDVPRGRNSLTSRHLKDRFEYYLRNQDDEGSYGLHNFH